MEFCVGIEYLNFRATCKLCHLAAPVIRSSNEKARRRMQTYSLSSPWLTAFQKDLGIISFTDLMFGDKYLIKASQELFYYKRILCSNYGWLLLYVGLQRMVFFNPFTNDIHKLPRVHPVDTFCFSAPPTSPDCMVVAFSTIDVPFRLFSLLAAVVSLSPSPGIHSVLYCILLFFSLINFTGFRPFTKKKQLMALFTSTL